MEVALIDHGMVSCFDKQVEDCHIVPIDLALIVMNFRLMSIANENEPSGICVDSSRDCSRMVPYFDKMVEDRAH